MSSATRRGDRPADRAWRAVRRREGGALHLTREGGHSHRRIVHVADATGWAIQQALEAAAGQASQYHPGARHGGDRPGHRAPRDDFSTSGAVHGLYAYNRKTKRVETLTARATILATGGAGRAYLYSTAPRGATGDGIAMAWRAGCRISNMEFMQFHPTCLYNLEVKNFLITEAVRGEGGHLEATARSDGGGTASCPTTTSAPSLRRATSSPARSTTRSSAIGLDYVHLDISHREPEFVKAHFPNIYEQLLGPRHRHHQGADPGRAGAALHLRRRGRGPRRPDRRAGAVCRRRSHPVGAARRQPAGVQQPARMPGVRRGGGAAHRRQLGRSAATPPAIRAWDESRVTDSDEEVVIQQIWGEIRRFMWNFVGIVRTTKRLERAKHRIDMLRQEVGDYYRNFRVTPDLIELAQPGRSRRPDRPLGAEPPRKPRTALHARLSRNVEGSEGHSPRAVTTKLTHKKRIRGLSVLSVSGTLNIDCRQSLRFWPQLRVDPFYQVGTLLLACRTAFSSLPC